MTWKYALVKVLERDEETHCELMELYDTDNNGDFRSYCPARIHTIEELDCAHKHIHKDGVNTWFFDNGTFCFDEEMGFWNWIPK